MNRSIALVFFLLLQFNVKAEFEAMAMHELIIKSDKIVYGEIIDLSPTHFELAIIASLTGDSGTLKIRRFENWTCAWRWTKYKEGQKLLVFVRSWQGDFYSMGAGNEGELPVVNDEIYINGLSLMYVDGDQNDWQNMDFTFKGEHFDIYGGDFFGTKMKMNNFMESARFVRHCFSFDNGNNLRESNWEFKCERKEIKEMAKSSLLVKAILREAKENNRK